MKRLRAYWLLLRQTLSAWADDYAPSMGAAIAYYTVFSIAPLLLLVIAVAGLAFGREAVQSGIIAQAEGLMGSQGAAAIESLLQNAAEPSTGVTAAIVSIALLIFGATTVFAEIQNALDRIWHVPPSRKPRGVWEFVRTRLLSFGLILGLAFLVLVSLIVSAAVAALGNWWGPFLAGTELLLQALNLSVSVLVEAALFAMIYKLMPRTPIAWRDVWVGAFTTAALFELGKFGIGLYLGKSGVASAFGAAGSLAVLLIWVYYSAQIFLLGAEFTRAHAQSRGGSERSTTEPRRAPRRELS